MKLGFCFDEFLLFSWCFVKLCLGKALVPHRAGRVVPDSASLVIYFYFTQIPIYFCVEKTD